MTIESALLSNIKKNTKAADFDFVYEVIHDFWICLVSRETSIMGRREVLRGKAKFGILGDGKEVPQVAMARAFKKGDYRSGYYRDQTLMFALGVSTVEEFFSQLYADPYNDPFSSGRQMNAHFATPFVDEHGEWVDQKNKINISSDISCTAGQMARGLGLATASKKYRASKIIGDNKFSNNGNEICFCTIGDASTSEGVFWETMNAAGVTQVPLLVSVWDDGYGISVPVELQTIKASISDAMQGFALNENGQGIYIEKIEGWDYPKLCAAYDRISKNVRENQIPALLHVVEVTQPQGHSTSGSHERYKSKERLQYEVDMDCITKMESWMIENGLIQKEFADQLRANAKSHVRDAKNNAWRAYQQLILPVKEKLETYIVRISESSASGLRDIKKEFLALQDPTYAELNAIARKLAFEAEINKVTITQELKEFAQDLYQKGQSRYKTNLYSSSDQSALKVPVVEPIYSELSETLNGYQVLNKYFEFVFNKYPNLYGFGEDVGQIGDVNQGFAGLQEKFGSDRIFDSGIREWTIIGQALGMSMRGLKCIAEIQYLDYIVYAIQPLMDDLATLRYRTNGLQQAPAIIRTRGHRLEGIWHAGSPLGVMINGFKGIYVCTPRNMVQAAGMYNTLLQGDDPAIVIECLNGYRLKEKAPDNLGVYTVPLGAPEILNQGQDITLVTYGSCVRYAQKALVLLKKFGIEVELIDVQTLIPFDLEHQISASVQKTNKILFLDEDVPGGATSYMMQHLLEIQDGFKHLDYPAMTLTAAEHRTPYGSDGDYYSKPSVEDIVQKVLTIMKDYDPERFSK